MLATSTTDLQLVQLPSDVRHHHAALMSVPIERESGQQEAQHVSLPPTAQDKARTCFGTTPSPAEHLKSPERSRRQQRYHRTRSASLPSQTSSWQQTGCRDLQVPRPCVQRQDADAQVLEVLLCVKPKVVEHFLRELAARSAIASATKNDVYLLANRLLPKPNKDHPHMDRNNAKPEMQSSCWRSNTLLALTAC